MLFTAAHRMPIASRIFPIFHLPVAVRLFLLFIFLLLEPVVVGSRGRFPLRSLHSVAYTRCRHEKRIHTRPGLGRVRVPSFSAITRNYHKSAAPRGAVVVVSSNNARAKSIQGTATPIDVVKSLPLLGYLHSGNELVRGESRLQVLHQIAVVARN